MTTNKTDETGRAGQAGVGAGVDTETGELTPAGVQAQRELDAFLGRAAAGGGRQQGGGGKPRKSKRKRSGGLSPFARKLLRFFLCIRYPLFGVIALFAGPSLMRRRYGQGGRRGPYRRSGVIGRARGAGKGKGR